MVHNSDERLPIEQIPYKLLSTVQIQIYLHHLHLLAHLGAHLDMPVRSSRAAATVEELASHHSKASL